ncbi:MAG TPA: hypothetical protein PLP95_12400, partial [Microthrixaceae bacterium]|nr:hypothetical protein [Microthrixaceae bacterium]
EPALSDPVAAGVGGPDPANPGRHLCYEGFPLESALARVSADHGAAAIIVSAERVRRGGVRGFFAREVFQVVVAVPDDAEIDPEDVDGALGLELGESAEFGDDLVEEDSEPIDLTVGAFATDQRVGGPQDDELWALLAAPLPRDPEPRAADRRGQPGSTVVPPPYPGAPGTPTDPHLIRLAPPPPRWPSTHQEPLVDAVVEPVVEAGVASLPFVVDVVESEAILAELVQPLKSLGPIASTTLVAGPARRSGVESIAEPRAEVVRAEAVRHAKAAFRASEPSRPVVSSRAGGPEVDLSAMLGALETSLVAVPAPPAAGVIALVGDLAEIITAAQSLARHLGVAAHDVHVVARGASASPVLGVVRPRSDAARNPQNRTLVAIELAAGRDGHEWTRSALAALDPRQIRFVADARRYLSHQHFSVAAVGGVDVVDLSGVGALAEPADALALGVPVATIDGRGATPEMWAAVLLAHRCSQRQGTTWSGAEDE